MDGNKKGTRRLWLNALPWITVFLIIAVGILIVYLTGSNKSDGTMPSPTVPAGLLQLTDLQSHTFEDFGISISYPSDWEEIQANGSGSKLIDSKTECMNVPFMIGVFPSWAINSTDLQFAIDYTLDLFIGKTGFTIISNDSITVNNISMIKVVTSDTSSYNCELWHVIIFLYKDNMLGNIIAYCRADCWKYYEPAIYTIASTYQFLE